MLRALRLLAATALAIGPAVLPAVSAAAAGLTFTTSTVEFYFSGDAGTAFECQLDSGSVSPCSSPASYSGVANGSHVFKVRPVASDGVAGDFQVINFTVAVPVAKPSASPKPSPSASPTASASPTSSPQSTATATSSPAASPTPSQAAGQSGQVKPTDSPSAGQAESSPEATATPAESTPVETEVAESPVAEPSESAAPTPDAAIGEPYDPNGTPAARAATVQSVTTGVVVAATMAAAAAAAASASAAAGASSASGGRGASGGSGGSGSGGSSSSDTSVPDFEQLDLAQDGLILQHRGLGDAWALGVPAWFGWLDKRSHRTVERVAPFSPLLAKVFNDGSYLRAMLGVFSLVPSLIALIFGFNPGWATLLTIVVLGIFDATAGLLGGVVFVSAFAVTAADLADLSGSGLLRVVSGLLLIAIAPGIVATTFRGIRRAHTTGFALIWERLIDLALTPFMAGWTVANLVGGLNALAGVNLEISTHATQFGFAVAIAMAGRVLFEEAAARWFPERLNAINPDEIDDPSILQRSVSLALKFVVWMLLAGALLGFSWQVWVGAALTILPSIAGWFSHRFPNFPWLWRILPQGLPALFVSLAVGALTAQLVKQAVGDVPALAAWTSLIIPLPLLALSVAGMFARHGNVDAEGVEEERFSKRHAWIYRVGGVVVFVAVLRLAGLI